MAERPFPPSPRRRGLARRSGLHAASPILVGALAAAAVAVALAVLGRAVADRLGAAIAAACRGQGGVEPSGIAGEVVELALPVLGVAAVVAIAAHLAQTRAGWIPRRRIEGAPTLPGDAGARARRGALDIIAAATIGTVAFGWLWWAAPRLAALPDLPLASGALLVSALAALAIAWTALGAGDALLRHAQLGRALQMTAQDKREDDRLSAADPRWRALRAKLGRGDVREDIAGATVLILGDGVAVAIAWDPVRRPVPIRIASGRGVRATQLLGLARERRVPVHREPALATALAGVGRVPEAKWPRLAEIAAAIRR